MQNSRNILATGILSASLALGLPGLAQARAHKGHHHSGGHAAVSAHRVSFIARVVKSSNGALVVKTRSGKTLTFSAQQLARPGKAGHRRAEVAAPAGNVTLNIVGLQPGELIQITETTDSTGATTITITLPPAAVTHAAQEISGTAENVGTDSFDVMSLDGSDYRMHMAATTLAASGPAECDTVDVTYHQDANMLIVDAVKVTGQDASCLASLNDSGSSDTGSDDSGDEAHAVGYIKSLSPTSITVNTDQGPVTASVDPTSELTRGLGAGDFVDLAYSQDATGANVADDISLVESDVAGKVTSVIANGGSFSLTITNAHGSYTFTPDYSNGADDAVFDGIRVGQIVDVTFAVVGGQTVADAVNPQ